MRFHYTQLFSTYSIVARDPETGWLGVAVQTHQMSVGRVVPWLLPGVGALATQSLSNVSFGPMGLTMLKEGVPASYVVAALAASDEGANRRQLGVVDAQGRAAAWTGDGCIPYASHHTGEGYSVQANMMTRDTVIPAMVAAYENASGNLAERMMAALMAAQEEDGDIRGMQSAALKVVSGDKNDPSWMTLYDVRVDEHADPVKELTRLVRLAGAQLLDRKASRAFDAGQREEALAGWALARAQAPELEEIPFWQAVTLADNDGDIEAAATILRSVLANDPRREHWIDLLRRLEGCGLIERKGTADALITALG
ncbi:MAG: DUF1028 domain-containing protein [Anaerolineaceae bacterium]|nr:DUF1028 domain-containing protein [Anaerolineaceae bacterium]